MAFIVIEGLDGVGSTTQTRMLYDYLSKKGFSVIISAEPTKASLGKEIRRMLQEDDIEHDQDMLVSLALCFAADRMQHIAQVIKPALKANNIVILDRYVTSSYVYQGLNLPQNFIIEINKYALKPDYTIILDLDVHQAYQRLQHRHGPKDFYETLNNLAKIRDRYQQIYALDPQEKALIDASGSIEEVQERILQALRAILEL